MPTPRTAHVGGARSAGLGAATVSSLIDMVRTRAAVTRPQLVAASGLTARVVAQRVEEALATGLIVDGDLAPSSGGRQPRTLEFNPNAGFVLGGFIGHTELAVALMDLGGEVKAHRAIDWDMDNGPERAMEAVDRLFVEVLRHRRGERPWAITIGLPGPVEFASGKVVAPPMMPGWDGFSGRAWLRDRYDCPVWVDNDVHLMALGEWAAAPIPKRDMLFVEVSTGVGAGLVFDGKVVRGHSGGAGGIGHLRVTDDPTAVCRCGRVGCLEAVASGWKLLSDITDQAASSPAVLRAIERSGQLQMGDLGRLASDGDELVVSAIQRAALRVSEHIAHLLNFTNPGSLVLGGGVLHSGPWFLDVMRAVVTSRATELALRDLEIRAASLNHHEALIGAGLLGIENILNPIALSRWLDDRAPFARSAELQRLAA